MRVDRSIRTWRPRDLALLCGALVLGGWYHRQAFLDIVAIGLRDAEQSHVFLAPIVAVWLLWLRRSRFVFIRHQPSWYGPAIVAGATLLSWWGFARGVQVAWHGGAVLAMLGLVISMTGLTAMRVMLPVVAVLVFLLPVPGELRHRVALPLQGMATTVTHAMLELFGVSAVKSGNVLVINGEQVAVGEACNGMRMVFALTLVVYAFVFGTPLKASMRLLLISLSPLIALACNVVRLVPTSLLYGYTTIERAQAFHDIAGWVMLPVALAALGLVLRTMRWLEFPVVRFRLVNP